jgi:TorA maturation chaperone TorD
MTATDVEFARSRAKVYDLLAAAFDGDADVLASALADDAFTRLAGLVAGDIDTETLERTAVDEEAIRVGYDNLFVVPGPHYVPPFASAHLDEPSAEAFESDSHYHEEGSAGELFGEPAAVAATFYDQVGFMSDRGDGIPDHLAVELEFMSVLAQREASLLTDDEYDEATLADLRTLERTFLEQNVHWLDTFAADVADVDTAEELFATLAAFAREFVAWDTAQMQHDHSQGGEGAQSVPSDD